MYAKAFEAVRLFTDVGLRNPRLVSEIHLSSAFQQIGCLCLRDLTRPTNKAAMLTNRNVVHERSTCMRVINGLEFLPYDFPAADGNSAQLGKTPKFLWVYGCRRRL